MNNNIHNIQIHSFNTRGLRNNFKRENIFKWLNTSHSGIVMLQEIHSISTDHQKWEKEWNRKIFFSHGEANNKGVATLIPKELMESFELLEFKSDNSGRFLLLDCTINDVQLILLNNYCPTKDNPSGQNNFYNYLWLTLIATRTLY